MKTDFKILLNFLFIIFGQALYCQIGTYDQLESDNGVGSIPLGQTFNNLSRYYKLEGEYTESYENKFLIPVDNQIFISGIKMNGTGYMYFWDYKLYKVELSYSHNRKTSEILLDSLNRRYGLGLNSTNGKILWKSSSIILELLIYNSQSGSLRVCLFENENQLKESIAKKENEKFKKMYPYKGNGKFKLTFQFFNKYFIQDIKHQELVKLFPDYNISYRDTNNGVIETQYAIAPRGAITLRCKQNNTKIIEAVFLGDTENNRNLTDFAIRAGYRPDLESNRIELIYGSSSSKHFIHPSGCKFSINGTHSYSWAK